MRFGLWFIVLLALFMLMPIAAAQEGAVLDGTHWQLVSLDGADPVAGTSITLRFGPDNSAGGSGGCNSYGSTYTQDASGRIIFADILSTMMACAQAIMDQEIAYLAALQSASAYQIVAGQLVITYGDGQTLVFNSAPTLPETRWRLVSLGGADRVDGSEITLAFSAQGNAVGNAGCNHYSSVYTHNIDGRIAFTDMNRMLVQCVNDPLMDQETAYLNALAAATTYILEGSSLTILYGDTGEALVFERMIDLAGTAWELERLGEAAIDIPVTLQFDDAGVVAGLGGCNRYSSRYTLSGTAIQLDPVVSTRMACEDEVMRVETAYFAALQAVERVEQVGSHLILTTPDGQALVFTPSATTSTQP
ncbi:MAG: META domain-containing protein [Anaerolineae bacterium]|nr:META domain-containing protein [Anaerolineae bacterium]